MPQSYQNAALWTSTAEHARTWPRIAVVICELFQVDNLPSGQDWRTSGKNNKTARTVFVRHFLDGICWSTFDSPCGHSPRPAPPPLQASQVTCGTEANYIFQLSKRPANQNALGAAMS